MRGMLILCSDLSENARSQRGRKCLSNGEEFEFLKTLPFSGVGMGGGESGKFILPLGKVVLFFLLLKENFRGVFF